ncbi:MAG: sigma-70 family RNA polymerase sigma factor [Clostridia bacterium]|nr:sigma-70 family RNA polymerase sigma factor [Clostridia bacterium]
MSKISLENLVQRARSGDKAAMNEIVAQLAPVVEIIASKNVGHCSLTRSDLIQEGMIGLLGAVYGYSSQGGAGFRTYASVCISNGISKAVEKQSARKHIPLNTYVPIDEVDEATDVSTDPQAILNMQVGIAELSELIHSELTELERETLRLHTAGQDNSSIAEALGVGEKSVDNALQRARRKLREKWIP